MNKTMENLKESSAYIHSKLDGRKVELAIVLGSGLGDLGVDLL